ncbi:hypothetical protein PG993_004717 [Apiospora rasikravindrae]|uniref:Uncharacterized protein n=1 Tax=Apiospora rasikravindrae TaxID=990691 RepID=A0ABR1TDM7_9PEZI
MPETPTHKVMDGFGPIPLLHLDETCLYQKYPRLFANEESPSSSLVASKNSPESFAVLLAQIPRERGRVEE